MEDTESFPYLLFLAGPIAGFLYHAYVARRYRNRKARYTYEQTTDVTTANLAYADDYIKMNRRQRSSSIHGRNDNAPMQRASYVMVHGDDLDTSPSTESPPEDS